MSKFVHPTAVVEEGAQIAPDVVVGPYSIVGRNVRLGEGTRLLGHVVLNGRTTVGRHNVIHPFTVIGSPPQDIADKGEGCEVVIGDHNVIRESVTINCGSNKGGARTTIGSHSYLMACSHVGHDCVVGSHVILVNSALLGGHAEIQDYAYLSAHVSIHQFATVGMYAFISGSSRIPRDAPPYMLSQGEDHEVVCVNTTGLKRRGFGSDVINALKESHRIIWASGLPLPDAIGTLKRMFNGHFKEVDFLIQFMQNSAKGKNGRARETLRNIPVPGKV